MITQLLFTPEVTEPVTHYAYYYLIGVAAYPFATGFAAKLVGRKLTTVPYKMAIASLLWPIAVWGVLASTIADHISQK